jgi:hypothetical protein
MRKRTFVSPAENQTQSSSPSLVALQTKLRDVDDFLFTTFFIISPTIEIGFAGQSAI